MTIKIEQEALLCVLTDQTQAPLEPSSVSLHRKDEEIIDESSLPYSSSNDSFVRSLRYSSYVEDCECFDDDCTVTTTSSSTVSSEPETRHVSFAETLVTEEWTRQRTPREEISNLFYSCDETARFRQEYRLERKLLSELDVDPGTHPVDSEDLSELLPEQSANNRHRISRVVVVHNDKLETFFNHQEPSSVPVKAVVQKDISDDFFDNDSFWSGSITWY